MCREYVGVWNCSQLVGPPLLNGVKAESIVSYLVLAMVPSERLSFKCCL